MRAILVEEGRVTDAADQLERQRF